MIMDENTTYRLSDITVNADELRRIRDELDELAAGYIALYRRIDNLIKQGTIPQKHANKENADIAGKALQEAGHGA